MRDVTRVYHQQVSEGARAPYALDESITLRPEGIQGGVSFPQRVTEAIAQMTRIYQCDSLADLGRNYQRLIRTVPQSHLIPRSEEFELTDWLAEAVPGGDTIVPSDDFLVHTRLTCPFKTPFDYSFLQGIGLIQRVRMRDFKIVEGVSFSAAELTLEDSTGEMPAVFMYKDPWKSDETDMLLAQWEKVRDSNVPFNISFQAMHPDYKIGSNGVRGKKIKILEIASAEKPQVDEDPLVRVLVPLQG